MILEIFYWSCLVVSLSNNNISYTTLLPCTVQKGCLYLSVFFQLRYLSINTNNKNIRKQTIINTHFYLNYITLNIHNKHAKCILGHDRKFHFYMNKPFYENLLNLKTEDLYNNYIQNDLTRHIQQTIKSLLIYES